MWKNQSVSRALIDTRTVKGHEQAKVIRIQKQSGKRNNWMNKKKM